MSFSFLIHSPVFPFPVIPVSSLAFSPFLSSFPYTYTFRGAPETYVTFPYSFSPSFPTAPISINVGLSPRPTPICVLGSPRSVPSAPTHWRPLWLSSRTAVSLRAVIPANRRLTTIFSPLSA